MTIGSGYCTLDELKDRLGVDDNADDAALASVVNAVSRWIDQDRNRRFYTTTNDETRYFTAKNSDRVVIDDLISLTTLKTDFDGDGTYETTWTATDYRLGPANLTPKLEISRRVYGSYYFPIFDDGVQVVGKFGYVSTTPAAIKEACLLVAMRVFGRKDMLYGVSGSADLGTLQAIANLGSDGEVKALLNSVPRRVI